ncbi:hypothetical protein GGP41_009565 [Bipolaris sorokiniana]|uniref:Uncharacterized protein n=2 Tax=Cochliobolus sativus TaxID=45130 RepID=A0A8H6DRY8_COCSA|nr:uncharacterized protein COCSADRAFT_151584 [Bipolaris sorokiniana ND90Pr]EMD60176.1 hypothetical protein COCSADRAFT_151584 [Bipolaris sorokiniana ND90Pr]KAF5845837.1 hypothetical protein GGP41_009565 [Bipolaris sorokiniana]
MAASKPSIRALSALAAGPRLLGPRLTVRQLSMTGSTSSSSLLTTDKPYGSNRSRGPIRLSGEHSAAVSEAPETANNVRRFNTSRSRKAVGDSSTLDFAYIPGFDPETRSAPLGIRVPILPWADVQGHSAESEGVVPMQPTIYAVGSDGTHIHSPSAMSDTTDNNSFGYQSIANSVASKFSATRQEGEGMARQIWNDLVDDIVGPKRGSTRA